MRMHAYSPRTIAVSILHTALAFGAVGCSDGMNMEMNHGDRSTPSSKPIAAIAYGALFVVNGGDSTVSVIDTEKAKVAGTIRLENADFPHHLSLSADRSKLSLAVPGMDLSAGHGGGTEGMTGAVMLLDATTGATIQARQTVAMNHNAAFSPDGTEIWTSQMAESGSVLVLDSNTLEEREMIEVGRQPAEVTFAANGRAFVANGGSASVTVIDAASKSVMETIAVEEDPVGAWQGANGIAYVDNEMAETVSAIDVNTLEVKFTYQLGFMPGMATLGPDDRLWVTDTERGKVVFYSPMSDMKLGELSAGAGAHAIAFDGNGGRAYVSNQMAGSVSVIDIATSSVVTTLSVGSKPNGMVWRSR